MVFALLMAGSMTLILASCAIFVWVVADLEMERVDRAMLFTAGLFLLFVGLTMGIYATGGGR